MSNVLGYNFAVYSFLRYVSKLRLCLGY